MTAAILAEQPSVGVLILSAYRDAEWPIKAARIGARGYLHAGVTLDVLSLAIRRIGAGGTATPEFDALVALGERLPEAG